MHASISDARADGDSRQSWDRGRMASLGSALAPRMKSPRDLSSASADSVIAAASLRTTPCRLGADVVTSVLGAVRASIELRLGKSQIVLAMCSQASKLQDALRLQRENANSHS